MTLLRLNNGAGTASGVRRISGQVQRLQEDGPCPCAVFVRSGSLTVNASPGASYVSHGMCLRTLIWCGAVACDGTYYTSVDKSVELSEANADYIMRRAKYVTYFGSVVPTVTTFPVVCQTVTDGDTKTCADHNPVSHTSWTAGADVSAHLPTLLALAADFASGWDIVPNAPHTLHLDLSIYKWRIGGGINGPIAGRLLHKIDYIVSCVYSGPCSEDCC